MKRRGALGVGIGVAAVAVLAGVAVRRWLADDETAAGARGGNLANPTKDGARAIESAEESRRDDDATAERTTEIASKPKRPPHELPVTWVEGVITLKETEYPPPPSPDEPWPAPIVHVIDAERLDGSFVPDLIDGPDDFEETEKVRVTDGRFRFDSHGATVLLMEELELDGRPAKVDGGVEVSTRDAVSVMARWIDDFLLHVVDAASHEALRDVAIVARPNGFDIHPGRVRRNEIVVEHQASPFHLTCRTSVQQVMLGSNLWVGAPDHAWKSLRLDFRDRAPLTVELEDGAHLVVEVEDPTERVNEIAIMRRPRLVLRAVGGRAAVVAAEQRRREPWINDDVPRELRVFDMLPLDEPMEFDGLVPGDYAASLEIGDADDRHLVLGRAEVKLAAGTTRRVTLTVEPDSIVEPVPVEGTLFVPPSWRQPASFVLRFTPEGVLGTVVADRSGISVNDMERVRGKDGWYRWRFGPILPGTYRVAADLADFETRIEVGPAGRNDVTIVLPEAAVLVVRVVDEQSKESVPYPWLTWRPLAEKMPRFAGVVRLVWDGNEEAMVGSVARGSGNLASEFVSRDQLHELVDPETSHVVHAGTNEITLTARRRCGIDLRLDADAIRVLGEDMHAQVEWTSVATGESRRLRWTGRAAQSVEAIGYVGESDGTTRESVRVDASRRTLGSNCIVLPAPGRYRFNFPDFPSITPFEIDVPPREIVQYTIQR